MKGTLRLSIKYRGSPGEGAMVIRQDCEGETTAIKMLALWYVGKTDLEHCVPKVYHHGLS